MFNVTVEGLDSLNEDLESLTEKIDAAVTAGLNTVLGDFKDSLASHVQEDAYKKYKPKKYKRTGAMGDEKNMTGNVSGNVLDFLYEFDTESDGNYYEDSDDVIRVVQSGKNYLWGVAIDPRPFWDNFIKEQLIGGQAEMSLVRGMNAKDSTLGVKSTKNSTTIDGSDTFNELNGDPKGETI